MGFYDCVITNISFTWFWLLGLFVLIEGEKNWSIIIKLFSNPIMALHVLFITNFYFTYSKFLFEQLFHRKLLFSRIKGEKYQKAGIYDQRTRRLKEFIVWLNLPYHIQSSLRLILRYKVEPQSVGFMHKFIRFYQMLIKKTAHNFLWREVYIHRWTLPITWGAELEEFQLEHILWAAFTSTSIGFLRL